MSQKSWVQSPEGVILFIFYSNAFGCIAERRRNLIVESSIAERRLISGKQADDLNVQIHMLDEQIVQQRLLVCVVARIFALLVDDAFALGLDGLLKKEKVVDVRHGWAGKKSIYICVGVDFSHGGKFNFKWFLDL